MSWSKGMRGWARDAAHAGVGEKPAKQKKLPGSRPRLTDQQCNEIAAAIRKHGKSYAIGSMRYSGPVVDWVQGEMYLGKFGGT